MNMTRYPLEIIVKTRGFYDQHGGKKVCFLTSGMALPAYRYDEGGYCAYVQRNGWNEPVNMTVVVEMGNVSSWHRKTQPEPDKS